MRAEYDLSKMKFRRNPYASRLKKPVTIRLGADVINYFKLMVKDIGAPYQNLIDFYLHDSIQSHRTVE